MVPADGLAFATTFVAAFATTFVEKTTAVDKKSYGS